MLNITIEQIISLNKDIESFWGGAIHGWAPEETEELLSKSRLDWQVQLSETLKLWNSNLLTDGQLILAWANLGALMEGSLKLLLVIFYTQYKEDIDNVKGKKGKVVTPDKIKLEGLKQFFAKKNILNESQIESIDFIQQRRNAIHSFANKEIGTADEYHKYVSKYFKILSDINNSLPYPERL